MSDSDTLLGQLARRVAAFVEATGITQKKLAKLIKTDETHLSAFLAGRSGLSAEKSLRLMQLLNSSKSQLEAKFRNPITSHIVELQEKGEVVTFRWVPGQSGTDPNRSTTIVHTPTARQKPNATDYEQKTDMGTGHLSDCSALLVKELVRP